MPFCQLANGLSQHFAEQPLYRPTLCCLHLCVLHFSQLFFFFFAFSLAEEATAPESWPLSRTQTVVWPHFWSRLLHSQPKVDFCTKNGTSKIIFWLDLSSNSFKNWIYQNMVVPIQVALLIYNDLFNRFFPKWWNCFLTLKIDFENQNVVIFDPAYTSHSKFYRVYYCWFHFLGKSLHLVGCVLQKWGHAKRQHHVVCQCSVSAVNPVFTDRGKAQSVL